MKIFQLSIILCALFFCAATLNAQTIIETWNIGSPNAADVTATLYDNGTMIISGTGAMEDYQPWVSHRNSITSVVIEDGVTTIGSLAFMNCFELHTVIFPQSLISIGDSAFFGSNALSTITIPGSVNIIGISAFAASGLFSVTIPDGVTVIGEAPFANCISLTDIIVDANNQNYSSEDGILFNKDKSTLIQYPAGKTNTYYSIPPEIVVIGGAAFEGSTTLTSVTIPNSVTTIIWSAFSNCINLTEVTCLAENPPTLGNVVFSNTSDDKTLYVPFGTTTAYIAADDQWSDFSIQELSAACPDPIASGTTGPLSWALCPDGTLTISGTGAMPDYDTSTNRAPWFVSDYISAVVIEEGVTTIGDHAFGLQTITSVSIPESLTIIGDYAFEGCQNLTTIILPQNLTTIGEWAFAGSGITSVTIPENVTSIGAQAFSSSGLTSVTISEGVTAISAHAFENCGRLTTVILPQSLITIGEWAFNYTAITTIIIPENVTYIGEGAFSGCLSLGSVTVHWLTPLAIDGSVFEGSDQSTTRLIVPQGTQTAYLEADVWKDFYFEGASEPIIAGTCDAITWEYDIAAATLTISGAGAIDCPDIPWGDFGSKVQTLILPEGITAIGRAMFSGFSSLTSVTIPESVVSIGELAFFLAGLTSVTIPEGVEYIERMAFRSIYSLTSVVFLGKVSSIDDGAFSDNPSLTSVTVHWDSPTGISIGEDIFGDDYSGNNLPAATLYVPAGTSALYENVEPWSDFGNIVEIQSDPCAFTFIAQPIGGAICENDSHEFSVLISEPPAGLTYFYEWQRQTDGGAWVPAVGAALHIFQFFYADVAGNYRCVVSLADGVNVLCSEISDVATLIVDKRPEVPEISARSVCIGEDFTASVVEGSIITNGRDLLTFSWTMGGVEVAGGAVENNIVPPLTIANAQVSQNDFYYLTVTNECGSSTAQQYMIVRSTPPPPTPASRFYCMGEVAEEMFIFETNNTARWFPDMDSNETIPPPTPDTSIPGRQEWYVSQIVEYPDGVFCESERTEASAVVREVSPVPSFVPFHETCLYAANVIIEAEGVNLRWYDDDKMQFSVAPMINIVTSRAGMQTYYVTQMETDKCESAIEDGTISVLVRDCNEETFFTIQAAAVVVQSVITVRGIAPANTAVSVYDGNVKIGETTALSTGHWILQCALHQPNALSTHQLRAEISLSGGITLTTETVAVTHNVAAIVVSRVTMYNSAIPVAGMDSHEYVTVFDFLNPGLTGDEYMYSEDFPRFTFTIEFTSNDPARISNARLHIFTESGDVETLPAIFDSEQQFWITTGDFDIDNLPVNVNVSFSTNAEAFFDSDYMQAVSDELTDFLNDIVESSDDADSLLSDILEELHKPNPAPAIVAGLRSRFPAHPPTTPTPVEVVAELENMSRDDFDTLIDVTSNETDEIVSKVRDFNTDLVQSANDFSLYGVRIIELNDGRIATITTVPCDGLSENDFLNDDSWLKIPTTSDERFIYMKSSEREYALVDFDRNIYKTVIIEQGMVGLSVSHDVWLQTREGLNVAIEHLSSGFSENDYNAMITGYQNELQELERLDQDLFNQLNGVSIRQLSASESDLVALSVQQNNIEIMRAELLHALNKHIKYGESLRRIPEYLAIVSGVQRAYSDAHHNGVRVDALEPEIPAQADVIEKERVITNIGNIRLRHVDDYSGAFNRVISFINIDLTSSNLNMAALALAIIEAENEWNLSSRFNNITDNLIKSSEGDIEVLRVEYAGGNVLELLAHGPCPSAIPVIESSGYVYEAISSNRLKDVMITAWYKNEEGEAEFWRDEQNPQITNEFGVYALNVHQGIWRAVFELDGYQTFTSEWREVPPPFETTVSMMRTAPPAVSVVQGYNTGIVIEFNKYMQSGSLTSDYITITRNGATVSGSVNILNSDENPDNPAEFFASRARFVPDAPFDAADAVTLTVNGNVKSYAGVAMGADYVQQIAIVEEVLAFTVSSALDILSHGSGIIEVSAEPASLVAGMNITARSLAQSLVSVDGSATLDAAGKAQLQVKGFLPGEARITVSLEETDWSANTTVRVSLPSPHININSESLNFGDVEIESVAEAQNVGAEGFFIIGSLNYRIVGADASSFIISSVAWSSTNGGNLNVTFAPSDEREYSAVLEFFTSTVTRTVALSGRGAPKSEPPPPPPPPPPPTTNVETSEAPKFNVFPNPSDAQFNVVFDKEDTYRISITDVAGRTVFVETVSGLSTHIDATRFPNGTYILTIENSEGRTTARIVVNR